MGGGATHITSNQQRFRCTRFRLAAQAVVTLLAASGMLSLGLYVFRAPILTWVGQQLVSADPTMPADVIVVLAGGTPEREIAAAGLYGAGVAPRIVLTVEPERVGYAHLRARGLTVPTPLEERLRFLKGLGVPTPSIVVIQDRPVASTLDESEIVSRWSRSAHVRRLIVVTSPFHLARSRLVFRRALRGSGIEISMHPATLDDFRADQWWRDRANLRTGILEWQKLIYYRLRYH